MPSLASAPCRPKSLPFICARAASIVPARSIFYRLVVNAYSLHEVTNELRNLICGGVEREMTSIEDVDIGFRHIFAVTFRFSEIEREIVLTPDCLSALEFNKPVCQDRSPDPEGSPTSATFFWPTSDGFSPISKAASKAMVRPSHSIWPTRSS